MAKGFSKPHPKTLRPDVSWPCSDVEKEPFYHQFEIGEKVLIKPDICVEGYELGGQQGMITEITSYLMVTATGKNVRTGESETKNFKLLRYEVASMKDDDEYQKILDFWSGKK